MSSHPGHEKRGDTVPHQDEIEALIEEQSGSLPVSCWLRSSGLNVKTAGNHPILWTEVDDSPASAIGLTDIPDGLGLSFAHDGSSATITATEDGVWSFAFTASVAYDTTFQGELIDTLDGQAVFVLLKTGVAFIAHLSPIYKLRAGESFTPAIATFSGAAGTPTASTGLVIVRLA